MGIVGNLDDLCLENVIQALSLSGQTGLFSLKDAGLEGEVLLRYGKIVWAQTNVSEDSSFSWLHRCGLVDKPRLEHALNQSHSAVPPQRVIEVLVERFGIERATMELAGRRNVEGVITEMLGWERGVFTFEACRPERLPDYLRSPWAFLLSDGIDRPGVFHDRQPSSSAQGELSVSAVTTGSVSCGEDGSIAASPDSKSKHSAATPPCRSSDCFGNQVFLVDDDPWILEKLSEALSALGWETKQFARNGDVRAELERTVAQGVRPILLIDLIMPRFNGDGILGGLELLQFVRLHYPEMLILMFSDFFCIETEKRIQDLGVEHLLVKPHRGCGATEADNAITVFIEQVIQVLPPMQAPQSPKTNLGSDEENSSLDYPSAMYEEETNPFKQQLTLLKNLSSELSGPDPGEQIRLLILRFAAELFDRAIIFSIIEGNLQATGQFGFEAFSGINGNRLKNLAVSLHEPSIFSPVLENWVPYKRELTPGDWEECLGDWLGGVAAAQFFLGPVICNDKLDLILYGDTLSDGPGIGETAALEIFLQQVGLVKERERLKSALASISRQV